MTNKKHPLGFVCRLLCAHDTFMREETSAQIRARLVGDQITLRRVLADLESLSDYANCGRRSWAKHYVRELLETLEEAIACLNDHGELVDDDWLTDDDEVTEDDER